MKRLLSFALILVLAISCSKKVEGPTQDQILHATLWYQQSAEFKSLSYQAFNLARMRLDLDAEMNVGKKEKRAVVVDVDETILDNSPYQADVIASNKPFDQESWTAWVKKEKAKALPGAVEFLNYATSKGVRVFYISNRIAETEAESTYNNLKAVGLTLAKDDMLFKVKSSEKTDRRQMVTDQGYRIVMLMGDAMGDFNGDYGKKPHAEQKAQSDVDRERFGRDYIVLPNPMYGYWESAAYNYDYKLTEEEKFKARRASLIPSDK